MGGQILHKMPRSPRRLLGISVGVSIVGKKLSLTEEEGEERILRKKEQMKKVYERQNFLKKRFVENLHTEQLEKLLTRRRIENLNPKPLEKQRPDGELKT
ncbi:hypothetical protein TNCV_2304851 [Trichonephila clavipes]|nr:hypothetical protein TNCV_2304851 [Trichonephila clavipes]